MIRGPEDEFPDNPLRHFFLSMVVAPITLGTMAYLLQCCLPEGWESTVFSFAWVGAGWTSVSYRGGALLSLGEIAANLREVIRVFVMVAAWPLVVPSFIVEWRRCRALRKSSKHAQDLLDMERREELAREVAKEYEPLQPTRKSDQRKR